MSSGDQRLDLGDIVLRPWVEADAQALHRACQDAEIARWVDIPQPFRLEDALDFIEDARSMWADGSGAAFAIVDAGDDALLGAVSRYGPDGHHAILGNWVAREARGRGVGTRSLRAVADWTLATTDVVRLECFIVAGNEVSERMTQRAGFQREGVLRSWDLIRGTPVDCVAYSRIRADVPSETDGDPPSAAYDGSSAMPDTRDA